MLAGPCSLALALVGDHQWTRSSLTHQNRCAFRRGPTLSRLLGTSMVCKEARAGLESRASTLFRCGNRRTNKHSHPLVPVLLQVALQSLMAAASASTPKLPSTPCDGRRTRSWRSTARKRGGGLASLPNDGSKRRRVVRSSPANPRAQRQEAALGEAGEHGAPQHQQKAKVLPRLRRHLQDDHLFLIHILHLCKLGRG